MKKKYKAEDLLESHKQKIMKSKVASFDVFDTCVLRNVLNPIDLFSIMEEELGLQNFSNNRVEAERNCREISKKEDVSLEEIYKLLPEYNSQDIEAQYEIKHCRVNPEVMELYKFAKDQGKKIIFISDMYLPSKVIRDILKKCGYEGQLWVSNEYNSTKASGRLYDEVISELGINPGFICHIGDNYIADYYSAKNRKISATHYIAPRERLPFDSNLDLSIKYDYSLHSSLISEKITVSDQRDYWWRLGYVYAGYILVAFCRWLYQCAKSKKVKRLFFMSRDGQIIKEVFSVLYPEFEVHYMYSSRRMLVIASLTELDDEIVDVLCLDDESVDAKGIIERLDLGLIINSLFYDYYNAQKENNGKSAFDLAKEFILNHKAEILEAAAVERNELIKYLELLKFGKDSDAIVDIGWGLSSEKLLRKILILENKKDGFKAFYFGSRTNAYDSNKSYSYFFNNGYPKAYERVAFSCIEIVEHLFSSTHYSINKVVNLKPVYSNKNEDEEQRIINVRNQHQGILAYVNDRLKVEKEFGCNKCSSRQYVSIVLDKLINSPDLDDINNLGSLKHSVYIGSLNYRQLLPASELYDGSKLDKLIFLLKQSDSLWPSASRMILGKWFASIVTNYTLIIIAIKKIIRYWRNNGFKKLALKIKEKF